MRKGLVGLLLTVVFALLALSWNVSSPISARQNAPTATAVCNPKAEFSSLAFLEAQTTGDEAHDLTLLQQAQDEIAAQIAACGSIPTQTPTASETKVGTLTVNDARTATRAVLNDNRTATSTVKTATASFIAAYKPIARGELSSYADNHKGEKVKIQGRVFHVVNSLAFQMFLSDGVTAVYVESATPLTGIYENDHVTVYGQVGGYFEGTNSYGATIRQPAILGALVVKV